MGTVGGNGGNWPPDGGGSPEDLPELPPEWGEIVIPDTPAELAEESTRVRRELQRRQRRDRRRQILGLPQRVEAAGGSGPTGVRAPLLVMAIAVVVTLASLFAATWPGQPPAPRRPPVTGTPARSLPALDLVDTRGGTTPLRGALPAVILLVDGCECAALVADTAAAVRPDVTVVTVVTGTTPSAVPAPAGAASPTTGTPVRHLGDPTGELRLALDFGPPDGTAAVLLVTGDGDILRALPRTVSVDDFRADLARI